MMNKKQKAPTKIPRTSIGGIFRLLSRLPFFDKRSRKYSVKALLTDLEPRTKIWECGIWLDQGQEGACTGFSVCHEAAAAPVEVQDIINETAFDVYKRAKQIDKWPGEDYEGSSVLAAIKVGKERGWYEEYRWAFSIEDLVLSVSNLGPAVLGISWHEGMRTPDNTGYIHPTGKKLGGHAILCLGYDLGKDSFLLHNSWGKNWGTSGRCWIKKDDLAKLLKKKGEACIPTKRLLPDSNKESLLLS